MKLVDCIELNRKVLRYFANNITGIFHYQLKNVCVIVRNRPSRSFFVNNSETLAFLSTCKMIQVSFVQFDLICKLTIGIITYVQLICPITRRLLPDLV